VDDNQQTLSIRKIFLETRGYTCRRVQQRRSGARSFFVRGGVDLVLTELMMPGGGWFAPD